MTNREHFVPDADDGQAQAQCEQWELEYEQFCKEQAQRSYFDQQMAMINRYLKRNLKCEQET